MRRISNVIYSANKVKKHITFRFHLILTRIGATLTVAYLPSITQPPSWRSIIDQQPGGCRIRTGPVRSSALQLATPCVRCCPITPTRFRTYVGDLQRVAVTSLTTGFPILARNPHTVILNMLMYKFLYELIFDLNQIYDLWLV